MSDEDTATFEGVTATQDTSLALFVSIDGKKYWVPKKSIHDDSEVFEPGHSGKLVVMQWWAEKAGLV